MGCALIQGHLRRFPRFDPIDDAGVRILERLMRAKRLPAGHVYSRVGERIRARRALLILEGKVQVVGAGEPPLVRATLVRGDLMGVLGLVHGGRATVTARALVPTTTAALDDDDLARLARDHPALEACVQLLLATHLAHHSRAMRDRVAAQAAS